MQTAPTLSQIEAFLKSGDRRSAEELMDNYADYRAQQSLNKVVAAIYEHDTEANGAVDGFEAQMDVQSAAAIAAKYRDLHAIAIRQRDVTKKLYVSGRHAFFMHSGLSAKLADSLVASELQAGRAM